MKKRIFFMMAVSMLGLKTFSQQLNGNKLVTYYYSIYLDDVINETLRGGVDWSNTDISLSNKTITFNKTSGGNILEAYLLDTLYSLTSKKLEEKLQVDCLPLTELVGKLDASLGYPDIPMQGSLKKAVAKAPGYGNYLSLQILFNAGSAVGVGGMSLGGEVKPSTFIKLNIGDENTLKSSIKTSVTVKSQHSIGKKAMTVGGTKFNKAEDVYDVTSKLIGCYAEALDELIKQL